MSPKYHIGTAGWSYKDWVPSFYPKNQSAGFDWLQFYSHYFNCVEVNSTYYTYISPKIVEGWIRKVTDSDDFLFTIKLHQDFTHKKDFDQQKIKTVNSNLDLLKQAERLGGLLIQFPYSFSFDNTTADYVRVLKDIFQSYNCFVEVRHKSWLKKEALEMFKKLNLTYCTIDQPQIDEAIPFEPIITNDKAYLRFHGRNVKAWLKSINNFGKQQSYEEQSERYKYLYSPGELVEIDQKIKSIQEKVKEVYVIMNNHPQGDAIANAFELIHLLEEKDKVQMPSTIVKAYPRLETLLAAMNQ
ncbi:MAG: hypothetical protein A2315_08680 [Ignavibacteria bacterium RIFOXYB2_FULL_35_12]|nr:MAG: hypothetical protein A2058_12735 [Ignavibacteria bacterium GWA2_36_19]OGU49418.1 MAG: hypothetical protein A2006_11045 [Ignavibacteria bacterium GWC2_35_8]OGU59742.1 MAG: hypothetical protein A2X60_10280 [Ignavibacteria bacterium GWF2_35_20]OGU80643.1 MAG: hypothetical protein A2254_13465 [Ignavibacteria bacterium RIFOXYA2_FULL_35_9]OGU85210.1 MAG: hypothetical protein A3K31_11740 [Ignavibacteria bacterium RIFOXYA12_FULL_35_25]OGU91779.1 MAG: hypothetical protein A2492_07370 [Ignavibac